MTTKETMKKIIGNTPTLEMINCGDLHIDTTINSEDLGSEGDGYQRPLDLARVRRYAKSGFVWGVFKALNVVRRADGRLFVTDGQHSLYLATTFGVAKVPCLVTTVCNQREEAFLFELLNSNRKNVSASEKFQAAVKHKQDANVLEVLQVTHELGLRISANKTAPLTLTCPGILRNNVMRLSKDVVKESLSRLMANFDNTDMRIFHGDLIHGTCSFVNQTTKAELDTDTLWVNIKKSGKSPTDIIESAKSRKIASLSQGASVKSFVTEALKELSGVR